MDTKNEIPVCPHCKKALSPWEPPDGTTWGNDLQYVCFNDECEYFLKGWDHMWNTYKVKTSYRHRYDPKTGETGPLPVWSNDALKNLIKK